MKAWKVIVKIAIALAAIAGIVYVVATYGDRIVAWARKVLKRSECECCCDCDCEECDCEDDCENCQCECACECEEAVVAEQADFEG